MTQSQEGSPAGSTPTSPPGPSKLHHVRRRGLSGGDALDIAAPQVERVAFLGVVRMPVVDGRDAALDVVQDLRHRGRTVPTFVPVSQFGQAAKAGLDAIPHMR